MLAFGPVPSRRLGRSLGINNIPPKVCSYSCTYCQVGRTTSVRMQRRPFTPPEELLEAVRYRIESARLACEAIDYLTFVADGEPTLDIDLGREVELLGRLGLPIAVITNSSLLWLPDVREALRGASWVSLKLDSTRERTWRRINRPHGALHLRRVLDGMLAFAEEYSGELVTETMLLEDVNTAHEELEALGRFLEQLRPVRVALSTPIRPPAEERVVPASAAHVERASRILAERVGRIELLTAHEGDDFTATGDARQDLLSITAVHPMREEAVRRLLSSCGSDWQTVSALVDEQLLAVREYGGERFYARPAGSKVRSS
jgi:wyosine [tRNA(Phe)-imidazoG37] synthetase (radical SAM superfamily)